MFDIAPSELLVVGLVAIIFIGPKDLPRVMRMVGQWVGRGRTMARHFRSAVDDMIRESELAEMEQKWKAENERIMREHSTLIEGVAQPVGALSAPSDVPPHAGAPAHDATVIEHVIEHDAPATAAPDPIPDHATPPKPQV
jgi:sec-independent protein translocase protein TatB